MDQNRKGITQAELESLPEVENVVLWQPDYETPSCVTDVDGIQWAIGHYDGKLCKGRLAESGKAVGC